ncbi:Phage baseplate lysozyme [Candidatus Promineifilum breve]|uniref:Phage baseplate lysozyme n=1 Tax=Candidatus Promineifilum breve TaxID=1806508 RepID=A0A160T867_9CHLR|nr:GPW/gp25 family protein [Candidatus Promineifilum breve]CUS06222.1 Phage baseplate lysozyme [Candidatus Promineifilum breve]
MKKDIIGRGWAFPPGNDGRLRLIGGEEKIEQSIRLILTTRPGERPLRPEFGCAIHDLVFQGNTAALHAQLRQTIRAALLRWEPRIDPLDVAIDRPEQNVLDIHISYRLRDTNAVFNLVYPLFINEGALS